MTFLRTLFFVFLIHVPAFSSHKISEGTVKTVDGLSIAYQTSGSGTTALVFVHGWTGNSQWWNHQQQAFSDRYQVVQIDLAGHGKSDKGRKSWTARAYGEDIQAVCEILNLKRIVLIGHSMSGTNILWAQQLLGPKVVALVPVDTLNDLDHTQPEEETEAFFSALKKDWKAAMQNFSAYVFTEKTPVAVKEQLMKEMEGVDPKIAIPALETVYRTDARPLALKVAVPVRAIQGDIFPTNFEANRKYFKDYDYRTLKGYGHFPMLESPELFNYALDNVLRSLPHS
jgi:sigma-B regulation protein RsbQ